MANKEVAPRKFRVKKDDLELLISYSNELMIREIVYSIRMVKVKDVEYLEIVTRTAISKAARDEIVKEAKK